MRKIILLLSLLFACNNSPSSIPVLETKAPNITSEEIACKKDPMEKHYHVDWLVTFSPHGHATEVIVNAINTAKNTIYVQSYSFTSEPIAKALIQARQRGLEIEVVMDKSAKTAVGSMYRLLLNAGVDVFIDDKHAIAHNKVIILDKKTVFTGSFNFTKAAEFNNAENSISLGNAEIATEFYKNYQEHKIHSTHQNP